MCQDMAIAKGKMKADSAVFHDISECVMKNKT